MVAIRMPQLASKESKKNIKKGDGCWKRVQILGREEILSEYT
jgi:hypothetical protein